ncbi:MAG: nucleotidyltransferase family protein [Nitrospirota bacterium]
MTLPVAVLAGGLATRLRPLTERIPKALVDVAGKPFVEHQLDLLRRHGVNRVVLCVGHLGEMVEAAVGDGSRWGITVRYAYDGERPLGTGGALRQALPLLGERFLVLYGDSYLDCDYAAVEAAFIASGKLGLMTVFRNADRWDRSNVVFRDGRIVRHDKRNPAPDMSYIDYGLGALQAKAFDAFPAGAIDLSAIYEGLIARNELAGFEATQRFYEVGSPSGLEETRRYLSARERPR